MLQRMRNRLALLATVAAFGFGLAFSVTAAPETCQQCLARCDQMRANCTTAACVHEAKMCAIRDCRSACTN
ncbi:hypothetical protein SAMN04487939_101628 [Lysobacter sp. yr284]|uniref:hypothetical protein n=1 Tax=Lysobacter TaxID=68 RepID=UPI00089B9730|nr:hypothetical protein [Lysobacter sp. yr284]SDY28383.1 hypothetical protein SAMN04487939_101628 [Lysobacter sp. yr284]